jgi:hypothetical protein
MAKHFSEEDMAYSVTNGKTTDELEASDTGSDSENNYDNFVK